MRAAPRRTVVLTLAAAFVALLGLIGGATIAISKTVVATPTITSAPAKLAVSTSASFTFTGSNGVGFQCALDTTTFASCSSPKTYAGLTQGAHTFSVKATQGNESSVAATYSWTVDTVAPPAPSITTKPASPSNTTAPTFAFSDSESGVSFRCALDSAAYASCTSPRALSGLAQGSHTFRVLAVDAAGNVGAATTYTWAVDSIAPVAPTLTQKPTDPTPNATNTFAWTNPESGLTSQCGLENGAWFACTSPYTWVIATNNYGQHQFAVRSIDAAGNASAGTYYSFKYEKGLPSSGMPFTITGGVSGLVIGVAKPVSVTINNPNSVTIFVNSLTVALPSDSTPAGCSPATNLTLTQSNISSTKTVAVPANGSVTLPTSSGVTAPQLLLKNLPVNQDVCKNKSFPLTFSGSATN